MPIGDSLRGFLPELALTAAVVAVIFVDLLTTGRAGRRAGTAPALLALAGAGAALVATAGLSVGGGAWLFDGMIALDGFAVFFKLLLGLALVAVIWMSVASREVRGQPNEGEYYA